MQKVHRIVWLLVISALLLAACAPTPTPAPTAAPTTAPAQQPTAASAQPTLVPTQAPPSVAASSGDVQKLGSQTWKWISATDNSGKITTVPNPENYTLAFAADGTVQIKADCNNAQGTLYDRRQPDDDHGRPDDQTRLSAGFALGSIHHLVRRSSGLSVLG